MKHTRLVKIAHGPLSGEFGVIGRRLPNGKVAVRVISGIGRAVHLETHLTHAEFAPSADVSTGALRVLHRVAAGEPLRKGDLFAMGDLAKAALIAPEGTERWVPSPLGRALLDALLPIAGADNKSGRIQPS